MILLKKSNAFFITMILVGLVIGGLITGKGLASLPGKAGSELARVTPQQLGEYEKERQTAINNFLKQGLESYNKRKFLDAKAQFEKVLKIDATNQQAISYLKKCDAAIQGKAIPETEQPVVKSDKAAKQAEKVVIEKASRDKAEAEKVTVARQKAEQEAVAKKAREEKIAAEKAAKEKAAADKAAIARQKAEQEAAIKKFQEEKIAAEKAAKEKAAADKAAIARQKAEQEAAAKKAQEEKLAAEKATKEKASADKAAAARQKAEQEAAAKKAQEEKIAAEKAAKEKAAADKSAAASQKAEQEAAAKKSQEEKIAAEKAAKEKAAADKAVAARQKAEQEAAAKKAQEEKLAAEKAAKEKASADKAAARQKAEQETATKKAQEEKIAAEKAAKEKAAADKSAIAIQKAEQEATAKKAQEEKLATEKAAKEKASADKAAASRQKAEQEATAKKAQEEKLATEKAAKEKASADKAAASRQKAEQEAAAKKAQEEKIAAEKAAKEKASADKAAASRQKAEQEAAAKKAQEEKVAAEKKSKEQQAAIEKAQKEAQKQKTETIKMVEDKSQQEYIKSISTEGKKLYTSNKIEDLNESIILFEKVLAMDPGNSEAIRYRGLVQNKIEKKQEEAVKIKAQEEEKAKQPIESPKPIVAPKPAPVTPTPQANQISGDEKGRQEAIKRADEEEKRIRAERERVESTRITKEADDHFKAGNAYMNQGQILKAHDEWNAVLVLIPNHQGAKVMIEETRAEYEKALEAQRKTQELERIEAENDKRMNDPLITIDVTDQEIGDVLTQMGAVAGFNVVIGEGVKAKVSASFTGVSLKKALDTLLPLNGFKYVRQGDTIQVSLNLANKIYQITEEQLNKLRFAMIEDKIIQRLLYGPEAKTKVPGQELLLDERAHILTITDSQINIAKLDEFLQNLPPIRGEELITKTFTLRSGNSEEIRKLMQSLMSANPVKGISDEERKVILEPGSNTLVLRDSVENIKKAEEFLVDKNFLDKLTNQELAVKVFHLSPEETNMTPESLARKAELVNNVGEVLETMLYAAEGREKAYESGRRIFKDPRFGTITVVDTNDNLRKIEDYANQLPTGQEQKVISKIFQIKNADPNNLRNVINQILQESRPNAGSGGGTGSYGSGVISPGAGNGLSFLDCTVELIEVTGDTTNPQARLYIYTPARDREVTLSRGNSELVDEYRVRLISADVSRQEVEVEIRLASFTSVQRSQGNWQQSGNMYGTGPQGMQGPGQQGMYGTGQQGMLYGQNGMLQQPGLQQQPQTNYRRPTLRVDRSTNNIIVLAFDPADLQMIEEWINKLDVPILQVSIEAKFVEVSETKAKKLGIDWLIPSLSNWGSWKPIVDQVSFANSNSGRPDAVKNSSSVDPLITDLRSNNLMAGGTLLQFQTEGGLSMTLEMLEAEDVVNVINAPRVTALNQDRATLTITQPIPWMSYSISGNSITVTWQQESTAITLDVIPTIHADGSIILDITPTVDRVVGRMSQGYMLVPQSIWNLAGTAPVTSQMMENEIMGQPIIDRRSLKTRARVQDGGTIVLGGLIQEKEYTATSKVPILGDLPIMKYLFKRSTEYKDKNRLFIFLTATVVP